MSELYDQIMNQRSGFEKWVGRLPGFEGYLDKKARRKADRMLRDHIADQLSQRINRLTQIEKRLLDNGGLSYMSRTNSVKTKLQTFRDRVATAAPGYSGPFEQIKIGPEQLDELYAFDEALIRYADQFDTALNTLSEAASSNTGIDEAINALDSLTVEANEAFSLREDVLTNLSKSI
jgi:hypothetical protein